MFPRKIKLFKLFGFEVGVDISWVLIAILIAWSLSTGLFRVQYRALGPQAHWIMGIAGTIGLFASIVFHEFWHSLVARHYGLPMKGITLFIFGGVAEMDEEPKTPKVELLMAAAGPAASIVLGAFFYLLYYAVLFVGWPKWLFGILNYLGMINIGLAIFNMIPAFPLDGGRILRSILWRWKNDLRWATEISSSIGSGFGIFLIVIGVWNVITGSFISGMWWFLIGLFLRSVAQSSQQQVLARKALEGEPLMRFTNKEPVSVPPSATLQDFVENYVYRFHYKMFPVVEGGRLIGCLATRDIKETPREDWPRLKVGNISRACSLENTIQAGAEAIEALAKMRQTGNSRLMVTDGEKLVGVVALKDLLEFLALKLELEG